MEFGFGRVAGLELAGPQSEFEGDMLNVAEHFGTSDRNLDIADKVFGHSAISQTVEGKKAVRNMIEEVAGELPLAAAENQEPQARRADRTSAGGVSHRYGSFALEEALKGRHTSLEREVSPLRGLADTVERKPGPHGPGRGCVGPPGLNGTPVSLRLKSFPAEKTYVSDERLSSLMSWIQQAGVGGCKEHEQLLNVMRSQLDASLATMELSRVRILLLTFGLSFDAQTTREQRQRWIDVLLTRWRAAGKSSLRSELAASITGGIVFTTHK